MIWYYVILLFDICGILPPRPTPGVHHIAPISGVSHPRWPYHPQHCPGGRGCQAGLWRPPGAVSAGVSSVICPRTLAGPCQWLCSMGDTPFVQVGQHTHTLSTGHPSWLLVWAAGLPAASSGPASPVARSFSTKSLYREHHVQYSLINKVA